MIRRATALFLLAVAVLTAAGAALSFGQESVVDTLTFGLLLPVVLAGSGFLVVRRQPTNPIGWLFCGYALSVIVAELGQGYGYLAAERGLPAGELGEWIRVWSWLVDGVILLAILLLFPNGKLSGPRWRVALWVGLLGCLLALPGQALNPEFGSAFSSGVNPFAVEDPLIDLISTIGLVLILSALVAAVACVGRRLHRAAGVERQQLKWFALAAGFLVAVSPFAALFWYDSFLVQVVASLAFSAVPVAATVAILRYRLYGIDIVINRTLVYGALTATLAASYLVGVLLLQFALSPVSQRSELAVAGSTLAVAALFRPARRRIQAFVDRRFYRSRYDARRTLESFSGRLRDQLDVDELRADLSNVVRETLQPEHVSLWLPTHETSR